MMQEQLQTTLDELCRPYGDRRLHRCQLELTGVDENSYQLGGTVLDKAVLQSVRAGLQERWPALRFDASAVTVLRSDSPTIVAVNTNLTGLYAEPSFLAEMMSQLLNGAQVEILQERDRWRFVRQTDGYLGWMYGPCLAGPPDAPSTHLICEPVALLRQAPGPDAPLVGRVLAGTAVAVTDVQELWVQVELVGGLVGWLPVGDIRPLTMLPLPPTAAREQMVEDGLQLIGVPYLWGGGTAFGIDCSGMVQLLYRLVGLTLPRDADMQFAAGERVEPPFEPGDLLFFGSAQGHRSISHVGMSLGGWEMLHSSRSRNGVYVDNVQDAGWLREIYVGAARFLD